jgi:hypothetical protein
MILMNKMTQEEPRGTDELMNLKTDDMVDVLEEMMYWHTIIFIPELNFEEGSVSIEPVIHK